MKPKSLLLIFGGMTLSFALILGVMLAAFSPDPKPRRKTTRARVVEEASAPRPTVGRRCAAGLGRISGRLARCC